jgi:hypothetical protein
VAQVEAVVETDGVTYDIGWESMSLVDVVHLDMLPEAELNWQYRKDRWD